MDCFWYSTLKGKEMTWNLDKYIWIENECILGLHELRKTCDLDISDQYCENNLNCDTGKN